MRRVTSPTATWRILAGYDPIVALFGSFILVRVDIVVVSGIGRKLFSVMTPAKKDIATIFENKNPSLEGFNVTMPLRSEIGDLYSFVLD